MGLARLRLTLASLLIIVSVSANAANPKYTWTFPNHTQISFEFIGMGRDLISITDPQGNVLEDGTAYFTTIGGIPVPEGTKTISGIPEGIKLIPTDPAVTEIAVICKRLPWHAAESPDDQIKMWTWIFSDEGLRRGYDAAELDPGSVANWKKGDFEKNISVGNDPTARNLFPPKSGKSLFIQFPQSTAEVPIKIKRSDDRSETELRERYWRSISSTGMDEQGLVDFRNYLMEHVDIKPSAESGSPNRIDFFKKMSVANFEALLELDTEWMIEQLGTQTEASHLTEAKLFALATGNHRGIAVAATRSLSLVDGLSQPSRNLIYGRLSELDPEMREAALSCIGENLGATKAEVRVLKNIVRATSDIPFRAKLAAQLGNLASCDAKFGVKP